MIKPKPEELIDRREAIRYLGYGKQSPDSEILEQMQECEHELIRVMQPDYLWMPVDITKTEQGLCTRPGGLMLSGIAIQKHLEGCEQAVLSCSTLGNKVDYLIDQVQKQDMLKALLLDAEANAAIEQLRLFVEQRIAENFPEYTVRWQFGIGYGDLPLTLQPVLLEVLHAKEKIGLSANQKNILSPLKSVSGILGLQKKNLSVPESDKTENTQGCQNCSYNLSCKYQKNK